MTLAPWQHQLKNKLKDGDMFASEHDYDLALSQYKAAFSLIPEPKDRFKEGTEVITAIGDLYLLQNKLDDAEQAFRDVQLYPDGAREPYTRVRRAEVFYRQGDERAALIELVTVCLNDGKELLQSYEKEMPWLAKLLPTVISQF
ncbi:tetratricopeptide repeat protein [Shewanella sp.]|uniref:tetratricopeptide repeat protein n=1 Tax=Shewanella sp. TaxID=50422 RepID=UPI003A969E23